MSKRSKDLYRKNRRQKKLGFVHKKKWEEAKAMFALLTGKASKEKPCPPPSR